MAKACDLNTQKYWSHKNPQGKQWEFFREAGYYYRYAGENLAVNITDENVVGRWMASPTHRAIILGKNYIDGAVSRCGEYLVLHAGTPSKKATITRWSK